jgi:hypothetical protein
VILLLLAVIPSFGWGKSWFKGRLVGRWFGAIWSVNFFEGAGLSLCKETEFEDLGLGYWPGRVAGV